MNTISSCYTCDSLTKTDLTIFQTDFWKIDLANNQAYLGRSFISLKRHTKDLGSLTVDEWADLGKIIRRFEGLLTETFDATGFNWTALMNDAYKNNPPNPHVHFHAWPRYQTAPTVSGVKFDDPNFAHHYDKKASRLVETELLEEIRSILVANLDQPD